MRVDTLKGRIRRTYYNTCNNRVGRSLVEVYGGNPISDQSLDWFLEVGFVPGDRTLFEGISCLPGGCRIDVSPGGYRVMEGFRYESLVDRARYEDAGFEELVREGRRILSETIARLYGGAGTRTVLALTSGLDSRGILGGLLECTESSNIAAFTWGAPGTYDYEIGREIARAYSLPHRAYVIDEYALSEERLLQFAEKSDCNVTLFNHWPYEWVVRDFGKESPLWLGLVGGSASGSNLPQSSVEDPATAFLEMNRMFSPIRSLARALRGSGPCSDDVIDASDYIEDITYDTLDLYHHHERQIGHIKLFGDLQYVLPFAEDEWLAFFLSVPEEYRRGRRLWRAIITSAYPRLARFRSNRSFGMPLNGGRVDYAVHRLKKAWRVLQGGREFRRARKYHDMRNVLESKVVDAALQRLVSRRGLVEGTAVRRLCEEHRRGIADHGNAIGILASLELILTRVGYAHA